MRKRILGILFDVIVFPFVLMVVIVLSPLILVTEVIVFYREHYKNEEAQHEL